MASLIKDKNGTRRIEFVDRDKKRKRIRLGKMPLRECKTVLSNIEHLVVAQIIGQAIENEVAQWVKELPEWLYKRIANSGLLKKRESPFLIEFVNGYIESRTDVKPRTRMKFEAVRDYLKKHFGESVLMRDITQGDADSFCIFLKKTLSTSSVAKYMQISKQFFESARRNRLIQENPFEGQKTTMSGNRDKFYFVSREEIKAILKACPDAEWRLIVALARFGGLRCPSEHLALKWSDIDWEANRIFVPSPKTEHHEGKEVRKIPLFPELRKALDDVWDLPETEGKTFVINRYRDTNANLRTQFHRIIKRAGLQKWPKPFQNLRSTRETELANEYPIQVVCEWIGNSPKIAIKHYLQTTEEHFEKAINEEAQKAAQSVSYSSETEATEEPQEIEKPRKNRKNTGRGSSKDRRDRNRTCTGYPTGS